jgi:hypothetical protein
MNRLPKSLLSFGAVALAAGVLTLAFPRAAHAVAAVLVEVTNTRSNPVPNQDVDAPGRHPYQQSCSTTSITCFMPVVPPNTEVVIQTVSMTFSGGTPGSLILSSVGGGVGVNTYIPLVAEPDGSFAVTQPLTQYADPGGSASCSDSTIAHSAGSFTCTITGYSISLP